MIHRITGWCRGFVQVKLPGQQAERFINLCRNHGIYWWNLHWRRREKAVYGCISREDYFRLRPLVQKTGVFPLVVERYGGVFWLQRAGRRASFWWGILCFLFLLFFFSSRIWGIAVEGQSYHTKESILRYLEEKDVYGGVAANQVTCSELEARIREDFPDIGWVSVEKTGSKLYIRLEEVVLVEKEKEETPANLIAQESGTVVSIVTKKGTAKVRAGDRVKKGKTLISGRVKVVGDNDEIVGRKRVQAQGTVILQCKEEYQDLLPKRYQKKMYTGRELDLYEIQFLKKNLFLYNPLNYLETYEKYDIIREGGRLCQFLSLRFPVSVWRKTHRETKYLSASYTQEEAEQILSERYAYHLEQLGEKDCFDLSGTLQVRETASGYEGTAEIIYSKVQDTYQELSASNRKKNREKKQGN